MARTSLRKFREIILLRPNDHNRWHYRIIFIPVDPRINTRYVNYLGSLTPFEVIMDFEQKCLKGTFNLDFLKTSYKSGPLKGEIKRYVVPEYATNESKKS